MCDYIYVLPMYVQMQCVGGSITICMSLAHISPFLSCELWINRMNAIRACSTVCASCTDTMREVTGLDSVMLSFTGSDVAACHCHEKKRGTEMVLQTRNHPLSEFLWFWSLCVSCCRKQKACSEKTCKRVSLDRLSVPLMEEFLLLMSTQLWKLVAWAE